MKPPHRVRREKRKNDCIGRKAEDKAGKRLNAVVHAGSGAIAGYKGDLTKNQFLMESKATEAKSLRVDLHWLRKITKEAMDVNKFPALLIQFVAADADTLPAGSWVAMPEYVFKELVDNHEIS